VSRYQRQLIVLREEKINKKYLKTEQLEHGFEKKK